MYKSERTRSTNLFRYGLSSFSQLAFQRLGITCQEAKTYVTLLQKAGVQQFEDLKSKLLPGYRWLLLTDD